MRDRSVGGYITAGILALGAVSVACLVISTSQSFHHCIEYAKSHEPYNNAFRSVSIIGHSFDRDRLVIACGSHFIDIHNGLITAIATGIVAVFTFTLWGTTRNLWKSSQDDILLAEGTAQRKLRAYISITPFFVESFTSFGYCRVQHVIKNHGTTPAFHFRIKGNIDIFPHPLPNNFRIPDFGEVQSEVTTVFPGEELKTVGSAKRHFYAEELEDALKGMTHKIYAFVRVEYQDCFGVDRHTLSAVTLNGDGLRSIALGGKEQTIIVFLPVGGYNDAI